MPNGYDEDYVPHGRGGRQSGDMIVKPREYVYILDETKGQVSVIVGPQKMSLAGTDKPVIFNSHSKQFDYVSDPGDAIQPFVSVVKGSYVQLENPAENASGPNGAHPAVGTISNYTALDDGCKVNLPGPAAFALWPGQASTVLDGHNLRSNQYLVCRVYDDDAAKENIHDAVIKTQTEGSEGDASEGEKVTKPNGHGKDTLLPVGDELVTGKLFIIKGTDVSFFIPPNGIEVLPDDSGNYIRAAVTLEQLEYCILLDESGDKRFEHGPQVVFPGPTERFVSRDTKGGEDQGGKYSSLRFRAIELNDISGIYIKVTAPYTDEKTGKEYEEGEELFITGKEQKIYFPRAEHVLIKYGDHEVHYAVAIPKGDAKYVMDRKTGEIETVEGPAMFLCDPREKVIVRRILSDDKAQIWFPKSTDAVAYNKSLREAATGPDDAFITERQYSSKRRGMRYSASRGSADDMMFLSAGTYNEDDASEEYAGDAISRKAKFTKPHSVVIDSKFDGSVKIRPWTGYAVQVVSGDGARRVVEGPTVLHLGYDEELENFTVSKGVPKDADRIKKDVYLRVLNNRVTDQVEIETSDMVKVRVTLSYNVNFTGDPDKWFNVENYVQHLCDNCRSILRHAGKGNDIQTFYENYIKIVRDTLIPADEEGVRGRLFDENGMLITEVEVLECEIVNRRIQELLEHAQQQSAHSLISVNEQKKLFEVETLKAELELEREKLMTALSTAKNEETRKRMDEEETTRKAEAAISLAKQESEHELDRNSFEGRQSLLVMKTEGNLELQRKEDTAEQERQGVLDIIAAAQLEREAAITKQAIESRQAETADYVARLKAEAQKAVEESGAVQPGLVEALTALSKAGMLEKISGELAPLAIVKGLSIGGTITGLFEGTAFEDTVKQLVANVEGDSTRAFLTEQPKHDPDRW